MSNNVEKLIYGAVNQPVLDIIPIDAKRILDLGCGNGALGRVLKRIRSVAVVGVTYFEDEAREAADLDQVIVGDLNNLDLTELGQFDCIVCSHVLEHLYHPEQVLRRVRERLKPTGTLIIGLPNVLFWKQRLQFLLGRFRYTQGGLMDETHFRFYDWSTAVNLVRDSGYRVVAAKADGGFPLSRFIPFLGKRLDRVAVRNFPGLFGFQFVVVGTPE